MIIIENKEEQIEINNSIVLLKKKSNSLYIKINSLILNGVI